MELFQKNSSSHVAADRHAELILVWLGWADKDYVAARRLLLNAYLPQGAALANTALEKYLKTLLLLVGHKIPRSHDIVSLCEFLASPLPSLNTVDGNFLKLLSKAYRLRYPDNLEIGFSISLAQPKLLVELDKTVHHIRKGFKFERSSGRPIQTWIDRLIETSDLDLLDKNCYFSNAQRAAVFNQLPNFYEMRVVAEENILEAYYQANIPDDEDFPLDGLRPQN